MRTAVARIWGTNTARGMVSVTKALPHRRAIRQHQELRLEKFKGSLFVCPKPGLLPFSLYALWLPYG